MASIACMASIAFSEVAEVQSQSIEGMFTPQVDLKNLPSQQKSNRYQRLGNLL